MSHNAERPLFRKRRRSPGTTRLAVALILVVISLVYVGLKWILPDSRAAEAARDRLLKERSAHQEVLDLHLVFGDVDENGDNVWSRREAGEYEPLARVWDAIDVDDDEHVSRDEFNRYRYRNILP